MSLIKKLAGETVIYGLSHILSRVILFVVFTSYLTHKLSADPSEYGIYSDMYSYATVILTILVFRMDTAFFRFGSKSNDLQKTFNTGFIAILVFCIIVLIILLPNIDRLSTWLHYNSSPHYIKWFAYILVLDAITALIFARLRLTSRPYRFMFYKLFNVGLTILIVLLFLEFLPRFYPDILTNINNYLGITRQIDYVFLANLIASAAVVIIMIPEFKSFKFSFDIALFKKMGWYALPLVAVGVAGNVNQAFAAPIQKLFLGDNIIENLASVGIYAAAAKLAILLNLFTTAFNYAAEPFFFKNADKKDSIKVYGKVALAFTIVACIVSLGLIFYIDLIILIIGEGYRSGVYVVPILLFAYIFLGLYYNVSIWYKLKDKTYIGAMISFVGMSITILMSIMLLPHIGAIGSAWAALLCYIVMVVLGYLIGQKYYPVDYPVVKILTYIATTALVSGLALYIRSIIGVSPIYFIGVTVCILGVLYWIYKREYKIITE
ncbi:MAG: polysaccharide biosynthesis C-terminal domain-containing protein [Saprospiraceae bacterium]